MLESLLCCRNLGALRQPTAILARRFLACNIGEKARMLVDRNHGHLLSRLVEWREGYRRQHLIGAEVKGYVVSIVVQNETPPLRLDSSGALRIGQSRVLLELVIRAFQDGATPEAIFQRYPTVMHLPL